MSKSEIFEEFEDMVAALAAEDAEFLVVGGYALAVHGVPRATGDFDVWVRPTVDNARRVYRALARFGAPLRAFGIREADLATPGQTLQLGLPPRRIDVLTEIDGVDFDTAWAGRIPGPVGSVTAPFIGRAALLANKRAAGRPKDVADIVLLTDDGDDDG